MHARNYLHRQWISKIFQPHQTVIYILQFIDTRTNTRTHTRSTQESGQHLTCKKKFHDWRIQKDKELRDDMTYIKHQRTKTHFLVCNIAEDLVKKSNISIRFTYKYPNSLILIYYFKNKIDLFLFLGKKMFFDSNSAEQDIRSMCVRLF